MFGCSATNLIEEAAGWVGKPEICSWMPSVTGSASSWHLRYSCDHSHSAHSFSVGSSKIALSFAVRCSQSCFDLEMPSSLVSDFCLAQNCILGFEVDSRCYSGSWGRRTGLGQATQRSQNAAGSS